MTVIDELAVNNVDIKKRKAVMGPFQNINHKNACEIASITVEFMLDILKENEELKMLDLDAYNAYNCSCRQTTYDFIVEKLSALVNYHKLLHDYEIQVDCDHMHSLFMRSITTQGLCSNESFYRIIKWGIQQKAEQEMVRKHPDFKL